VCSNVCAEKGQAAREALAAAAKEAEAGNKVGFCLCNAGGRHETLKAPEVSNYLLPYERGDAAK